MLLKRLEMSGFKSFAKPVTLEFPVPISAIVGPNGSGKSNVADAIRWVLGEQSMKSLRGKKGEDLIFGGTQQSARLGKASVSLVFDNSKKTFSYEFNDVIITRRVYRDGVNEYLLNNSSARLKDIIELLSKVGLGASQHHIIGQGDADRILYASAKERKSMIEEALGLKIFELKKNEAERKLLQTEENIKQIESLRRELKPHLKYLEDQAKKSQNVAKLREDLEMVTNEYIVRQRKTLDEDARKIEDQIAPLKHTVVSLETAMKKSEHAFGDDSGAQVFFAELKKLDEAHRSLQDKRRELERKLWGAEARAQSAPKGAAATAYPVSKVRSIIEDTIADLEFANRAHTVAEIREVINSLLESLRGIIDDLEGAPAPQEHAPKSDSADLEFIRKAVADIESEEKNILLSKTRLEEDYKQKSRHIQQEQSQYRAKTDELARARDSLRTVEFRREALEARNKEFAFDFNAADHAVFGRVSAEVFASAEEHDTMRRKIERLRIRIEEAGGVDDQVLTEFDETKKRDAFLAHELEDLEGAKKQVAEMFDELDRKIEKDFHAGLSKINALFGKFFKDIFGGGNAEVKLLKPPAKSPKDIETDQSEFEDIGEEEQEPGIEISVDIPRKRIKSLAMLSGGERALTSIALLFAMSTINPPPFLVLDETDAALDEANSSKYGAMLQELSKKAQLIVITHNRATMKVASVLYGVTMGGDGISKLLSIKFEDADDVLAKK